MRYQKTLGMTAGLVVLLGGLLALTRSQTPVAHDEKEQERSVTEAEVPQAALEALRKLAAGAAIREFAEEIEHGRKFYEGTWTGAAGGKVDALVTEAGDLVELEETIDAERVPAAVRAEARKHARGDRMSFERKTMLLYEIHFGPDEEGREMILTPDGRRFVEAGSIAGPSKRDRRHDDDDDEDEDADE